MSAILGIETILTQKQKSPNVRKNSVFVDCLTGLYLIFYLSGCRTL